jgi:hypothetical protein
MQGETGKSSGSQMRNGNGLEKAWWPRTDMVGHFRGVTGSSLTVDCGFKIRPTEEDLQRMGPVYVVYVLDDRL